MRALSEASLPLGSAEVARRASVLRGLCYFALHDLALDGYVTYDVVPAPAGASGKARYLYSITTQGRERLLRAEPAR